MDPPTVSDRFCRVKRLALALVAVSALAPAVAAGTSSNPAFLGIAMQPVPMHDGCGVSSVTPDSAAATAGVLQGDAVLALDGTPTRDCVQLAALIVAHHPGDNIRLDLLRGMEHVVVHAVLVTRAEVLNSKLAGHELESIDVVDYDDGTHYDLTTARGGTRVLAWFNAASCGDCAALVRRVVDTGEARRKESAPPRVIAVTSGDPDELATLKLSTRLGVPVAVAPERTFAGASMLEPDRAYFMVLDASGVVRFVTPIAPEADDVDAQIDEVLAAAAQAEHARSHR